MANISLDEIKDKYRNIPDFPKPGIQFKDITPLLQDPLFFEFLTDYIVQKYSTQGITKVVGIESRGFIFGGAIAAKLKAGFIPVRKPGKLPYDTYKVEYDLEYGTDALEIHSDALSSDDKVLIHDDLLATGGTAKATIQLIEQFDVPSIKLCFLSELDFLNGRKNISEKYDIFSLIHF